MGILAIRKYPDAALKRKTEKVDKMTNELKRIISDMIETMQKADGVGLAAPQVGLPQKIIIVQTEQGPAVFFNPKITKKSRASETEEEGCLSLPGVVLKIKRPQKIELEALNEKLEKIKLAAEGMLARVFQHEVDHLKGVLIIHKIPFWQRWKLLKQFKNQKNKKLII